MNFNLRKSFLGAIVGLAVAFASLTPQIVEATPQYTTTHRSAAMTDLVTAIGGTGFLMILTGAQPASVATVDGGTVLVVLPLSATAGTVSAGVLTFNSITPTAAIATGTAGHFLICTSSVQATCVAVTSTTRVAQGSVATSGADINAATVAFTSGTTITVSSLTITENGA
jgi:hypothetical protein